MNEDGVSNSLEPKEYVHAVSLWCSCQPLCAFPPSIRHSLGTNPHSIKLVRWLHAACHRCRCLRAAGFVLCRRIESLNFLDFEFTSKYSRYCFGGAGGSPDLFPAQCGRNFFYKLLKWAQCLHQVKTSTGAVDLYQPANTARIPRLH